MLEGTHGLADGTVRQAGGAQFKRAAHPVPALRARHGGALRRIGGAHGAAAWWLWTKAAVRWRLRGRQRGNHSRAVHLQGILLRMSRTPCQELSASAGKPLRIGGAHLRNHLLF
jgi:hypothetical protein